MPFCPSGGVIHTDAEIASAIKGVEGCFAREFEGCTLTTLYCPGDDLSDECSRRAADCGADEAIIICSNFNVDCLAETALWS